MSSQWKQKLEEKYEFMNKEKLAKQEMSPYTQWGIETQVGWKDIIETMCQRISDTLVKYKLPQDTFVPLQIKEKYASLRVYWKLKNENFSPPIDFIGGETLDFNDYSSELKKDLWVIVNEACEQSKTTCEMCGKAGEQRTDLRWVTTLCDKHYQERINYS